MRHIPRKKERRRDSRDLVRASVPILWEDERGREKRAEGRLMDVSASGARLWVPTRLPARTMVSFSCPKLAVGGRGTVRYCHTAKVGYEVGLEVHNGTGWTKQNGDLYNLAAAVESSDNVSDLSETVSNLVTKKQ